MEKKELEKKLELKKALLNEYASRVNTYKQIVENSLSEFNKILGQVQLLEELLEPAKEEIKKENKEEK